MNVAQLRAMHEQSEKHENMLENAKMRKEVADEVKPPGSGLLKALRPKVRSGPSRPVSIPQASGGPKINPEPAVVAYTQWNGSLRHAIIALYDRVTCNDPAHIAALQQHSDLNHALNEITLGCALITNPWIGAGLSAASCTAEHMLNKKMRSGLHPLVECVPDTAAPAV